MADNILRLRVDSQEYDNKIKRAAEGIQQYAQKCREVGGTLEHLDDGVLEFVQALGKMDTVATTTKQQLREMSNALTTLTMTYRGLTDEEKASPFGQELAKGIQQLTERAGQARDAMADVERSIKGAASDTRLFDQMAQGMSVATAGFQGLTGAGKLLGIEMGNDVQVIAKLQAAMAVTNSLTTIQNALQKESALMQGLNAAKAAASAAAHALLSKELSAAAIAQGALNIAMKAAPWMVVIGGVAALCDVLGIFSSSTDEASKSQSNFNNSLDRGAQLTQIQIGLLDELNKKKIQYDNLIGENTDYAELYNAQEKWIQLDELYRKMYNQNNASIFKKAGNGALFETYSYDELKKVYDAREAAAAEVDKIRTKIENADKSLRYFLGNWDKLKTKPKIQAAIGVISNFRDQFDLDSSAYKRYDDIVKKLQEKISPKTTVKVGATTTVKAENVTETQQLQKNIEALTKEYQQLSDVEKVADFNMAAGIELRKAAIRGEIKTNQQRIDELKKFADEAQGKNITVKVDVEPTVNGSSFTQESISKYVQELQKQLSSLDMSMGGASAMANDLYANIIDAQTFGNLLKTSIQHGIDLAAVGIDTTSLWEQITNGDGIEDADWKGFVEKINEQLKKQGIKLSIDTQTGNISTDKKEKNTTAKAIEKFNSDYSKLTGGVSSIVSGIQSMGVEIPKSIQSVLGVLTGISSIMSGIASILTVIEATTTIAAAKPFARGGIVHAAGGYVIPGNNFSGDMVPAYLNSQEMVLNKQQQMILAGTLENGGLKNITISGALRGEDIVLSADRWGRRTGKGELLFAKNL